MANRPTRGSPMGRTLGAGVAARAIVAGMAGGLGMAASTTGAGGADSQRGPRSRRWVAYRVRSTGYGVRGTGYGCPGPYGGGIRRGAARRRTGPFYAPSGPVTTVPNR